MPRHEVLSIEEVQKTLEKGCTVVLPEGVVPDRAEKAIRHIYGVGEEVQIQFAPYVKGERPPKNAIVSNIPLSSMIDGFRKEGDHTKIQITFCRFNHAH